MALHPYFDEIDDECWLGAEVVEVAPAAVIFKVLDVAVWDDALKHRLSNQFSVLRLAALYSSQAATELSDIRANLQQHFDFGGATAVRTELLRQWESRAANRRNSWQTATYRALADSDWYCDSGFSRV